MGRKSQCILVIDDDPATRSAIAVALRGAGYWVETARLGTEGLALASRFATSLILIDEQMPEISGLAVLERLKVDPMTARVPIVMMSDRLTPRLQARLAEAGVAAVVEKPVQSSRLLRIIERSLGGIR